jgi:hypothetical protein
LRIRAFHPHRARDHDAPNAPTVKAAIDLRLQRRVSVDFASSMGKILPQASTESGATGDPVVPEAPETRSAKKT